MPTTQFMAWALRKSGSQVCHAEACFQTKGHFVLSEGQVNIILRVVWLGLLGMCSIGSWGFQFWQTLQLLSSGFVSWWVGMHVCVHMVITCYLLFSPEDGSNILLQNVRLSLSSMVLQPWRLLFHLQPDSCL